ncbi:MAG: HU family DNA-binding protein [Paludibacter sp.]
MNKDKDKISIQEIIDLVALKASVSKRAAEEFLKVLIATIEDALLAGESVKIKGFGTFKLQWNEPRKSVNIQTGEEILLSGYHKVTFVPDTILKELVNEPFAHLEAVILNAPNDEKIEVETEVELNPLRIFEEQASEIKDLLSEIQALSSNSKKVFVENKIPIIAEEDLEIEPIINEEELTAILEVNEDVEKNSDDINYISEDEIEIEIIEEKIEIVPEEDSNSQLSEETKSEIETEKVVVSEGTFTSNPFIEIEKPRRKSRKWLWVTIIIILLTGGGVSSYLFYPPATDLVQSAVIGAKKFVVRFKEMASTTDMLNSIAKWVNPPKKEEVNTQTVIIPKDKVEGDSIIEEVTDDSLQMLFDAPRVYPEYIATERIVTGSRLARMAQRYYGTSDFWVYIYEANKDRIVNPDNIPTGTLIYIPKIDPRIIDGTNPRCLKKARELHDLYVK